MILGKRINPLFLKSTICVYAMYEHVTIPLKVIFCYLLYCYCMEPKGVEPFGLLLCKSVNYDPVYALRHQMLTSIYIKCKFLRLKITK